MRLDGRGNVCLEDPPGKDDVFSCLRKFEPCETASRAFIALFKHLVEIEMLHYSISPPSSGSSFRALPLQTPTEILAHTRCSINVPSFSK